MTHTASGERIANKGCRRKWLTVLLVGVIIFCCTFPMGFFDIWNGTIPRHRNQYELMAEAFLDGKLYIDYQEEDQLQHLENPYDPNERAEAEVEYHWDHAYYKGKYYMYFGVVPVVTLFLPYRILTGSALTSYHATQLYVALTIVGIFALFDLLRKRFFKALPPLTGIALSTVFSVITVRYSIAEPALYCTAITSALAFQIWSLYFFIKAVWVTEGENKQLVMASIGALLGALVFGCRPTIALANLLVIPMLVRFLRQRKITWALLGKLVLAALPYFVVGVLLMLYNYARFEDPFEFGQSYQLTLYNIRSYSSKYSLKKLKYMFRTLTEFWFKPVQIVGTFPFVKTNGLMFKYPIMLGLLGMCRPSFWKALHREKLTLTVVSIFILIAMISVLEIMWSPFLLARYQMDLYFILCILCFVVIGFTITTCPPKLQKILNIIFVALACISLFLCVLYYFDQLTDYHGAFVVRIGKLLFG